MLPPKFQSPAPEPRQIFSTRGYGVKINCRAEVNGDARPAIFLKCSNTIHDAVSANFLRIVIVNGHSGADARLNKKRFTLEISPRCLGQSAVERWYNGADDHSTQGTAFNACERKQITGQDPVFVHGLIARGSEAPVGCKLCAAEYSEHRVCVPDINGEQHRKPRRCPPLKLFQCARCRALRAATHWHRAPP